MIDKYLFSRYSVPFVLMLAVIGYIFIQDNGAGKLTNWPGIWWTLQKSGILLGLLFLILFFQFLYDRIFGGKI